jgi:hypothetical protein
MHVHASAHTKLQIQSMKAPQYTKIELYNLKEISLPCWTDKSHELLLIRTTLADKLCNNFIFNTLASQKVE